MSDIVEVYNQVAKVGFPVVFSYGLWKGWWYLKPHVDMLVGRLGELTGDLKQSREQTAQATALAEQAYGVAVAAQETGKANADTLGRIECDVRLLVDQLAGRA